MAREQARTFDFRDLAIWKIKLPDVKFALLPPSNNRPNPLATQERLYVSVFAPGAICALERNRGKLIWRRELSKYASASVHLHEGKLFAHTPTTLFALHPDSGKTLWSFCPYGSKGESIYSSPAAHENRVYIGDRRGCLHCLDAESGQTIWKRHTSRALNNDVNTTPVLTHGLVIVSTNARIAAAYDALTGKLAWKRKLDGTSIFGPLIHGGSILVVSDSLYALNPRTGKVRRRLSWSGREVSEAESTPQSIILTFRPDPWSTKLPSDKAKAEKMAAPERPSVVMRVIAKSGAQRNRSVAVYCPSLRYSPAARLLYVSHLHGIEIRRPATGKLLYRMTSNDGASGVGLVDVMDENIYALAGDGEVYALKHPGGYPASRDPRL